jgi:hypothetical protein
MDREMGESGVLPTGSVTKEQTVVLVQSLLVDWKVLEHLHEKGIVEKRFTLRDEAGCCAPDGGTCCVNKKKASVSVPDRPIEAGSGTFE